MEDAYKAVACGAASTWWYVDAATVRHFPPENIVRVQDTQGYWRCATVDRSQIHQVSETRPVMNANVQSCDDCEDSDPS